MSGQVVARSSTGKRVESESISASVDDASRRTTTTTKVTTMVSAMDEDETERMDERDVAEALSRETDERKRWGILERALESESVLHFGSISDALETVAGETDVARRVAEIFAFGNLGDYRARSGDLPALTTNQEIKLKRLSACGACASREKTVSYDDLMRAVEIGEERELERFIIDECVAKGIIRGRFDPKNRVFKVGRVLMRDCPKSRLENLQKRLEKWCDISGDLLESISEKNRAIKHEKAKSVAHREEIDQTVEALKAQFKVDVDPTTHSADMDEDGPSGVGAKRRR
jgi:COP9 signalosome complex subunit 7